MNARPRYRNAARQAMQEFLLRPLLIVLASALVAVVTVAADRGILPWLNGIRSALSIVIPPQTSTTLLETVTPGLLTIISIIFFVLLMVVQHQSSTYTPVVLDQFLRRQGNQLFFGGFVGLAVYCLLAVALLPSGQAVLSALVALLLCVLTLSLLLVFVYSTIDQMRPSATMWMIQKLALQARVHQRSLLDRCRTQPQRTDPPSLAVSSDQAGYIVDIDSAPLQRCFDHVPSESAEVRLLVTFGDHVVPGSTLASVHSHRDDHQEMMADAVLDAISLGRMRDIDHDPGHAVDHVGSMAWSAATSSADPEGAREAVETLHSLLVGFEQYDSDSESSGRALPIVHNDRMIGKTLDALASVITAAGNSGQHQTFGTVLIAFSEALPQLSEQHQQMAIDRLQRVLALSGQQVFTVEIERGFAALERTTHNLDMPNASEQLARMQNELASDHPLTTTRQAPASSASGR